MITAQYEGHGLLENADPHYPCDPVPTGGQFTTTEKRVAELRKQGIPVTKVNALKAVPAPADTAGAEEAKS